MNLIEWLASSIPTDAEIRALEAERSEEGDTD